MLWVKTSAWHFPCSIVTLAVTQREKSQHGKLEILTPRSPRPSTTWQHIHTSIDHGCRTLPISRVIHSHPPWQHKQYESVNEAWRELFCQKNKPMEHIQTNSGFPTAALKVSGLPDWDLNNVWTGPAADNQSRRMWVNVWQRQPVLASCVEHTTDGL